MSDLSTRYMGINLKNPLIAASSGLTDSVENIKKLEKNGIGAVVLKSIFEEEILNQEASILMEAQNNKMIYSELSETLDYIDLYIKDDTVNKYLRLIRDAKKETLVPIIASVNCVTSSEWIDFAKKIEGAGADGIELNIFLNPVDNSEKDFEETYLKISKKIALDLKIPVAVKISKYFTKPAKIIKDIAETDIKGLVLFNRFYAPDIDINKIEVKNASLISGSKEYLDTLRWIGLMHDKVECDFAASGGILSSEIIIKQILAGAKAVELCSILYDKGAEIIPTLLSEIEEWMESKKFNSPEQFRGKLSLSKTGDQAAYERMQFMKHFSGIE